MFYEIKLRFIFQNQHKNQTMCPFHGNAAGKNIWVLALRGAYSFDIIKHLAATQEKEAFVVVLMSLNQTASHFDEIPCLFPV